MSQENPTQELKTRLEQVERKCTALRRLVVCCLVVNLVVFIGFKLPTATIARAAPPATSPAVDQRAQEFAEQMKQELEAQMAAYRAREARQADWRKHKLGGATGVQEASEFRVVDGAGTTRAILGLDPNDKVRLLMYDAGGKELLSGPGETRMMPAQ